MFVRDIRTIALYMRVYSDQVGGDYDLGLPEKLILRYLAESGDVNQEAIAGELNFDKSSVAKSVVKLEEQGLVQRSVDERDRRSKIVRATEDAEDLIKEMFAAEQDYLERIFTDLPESEAEAFKRSVAKVARSSAAMLEEVS